MTTALANLDRRISLIEKGRQALAEAKSVSQVKEIRDQAKAIEHYLKEQNGAADAALHAAELKLRAEQRLGELIPELPSSKEGNGAGPPRKLPPGISHKQSHQWQRVASVPREKFEQHVERAKKDKDRQSLTTPALLRTAKEEQREARREENRELVRKCVPLERIEGPFPAIVIDPPWDFGDEGDADQLGRGRPTYETIPFDRLLELPVGKLADRNAHLYLWITNRSLPKGFALLERWGFRYVTCLTWCKPSIGMGNYFRGSTEQILFGVRGSLPLLRNDVGTWFEARRQGKHSAKPAEFFSLVESCSRGPWLGMFLRAGQERPGWVAWGAEAA